MSRTNASEEAAKAYQDGREGKSYEKPNDWFDHATAPQGDEHRQMIETDRAASDAYDRGKADRDR